MFKVLIIAYYFPPMGLSGVQRTLKFAKYMTKFNWKPTVITAGKTAYYAHDLSLLKEVEDAGINVIRTEAFDPNSLLSHYGTVRIPREFIRKVLSKLSKTFLIPDNKISWSKRAYKSAKSLLEKEQFDVIFVTLPPFSSFSMAAKLKKEFDIPLLVDYRDLWYGNHFAFYPSPFHKVEHKKLENDALRVVEKVIVINRKIKENLLTTYKFLNFEDIVIIPQGYDSADFNGVNPVLRENNKMRITYSGIFYEYITPKYFLHAFKQLSIERPDVTANIELDFTGYLRKENQRLITKLGLQEFVKEYGYLEHKEAIRTILGSDVLWMMVGKATNSDTISTGKLFEYFGTRKPIIACVPDGAAKSAAKEYGAAIITEPDNIEEIKNAILEINKLFKENKLPVPNEEFVQQHDREFLTEQLTKQFQFFLREEL